MDQHFSTLSGFDIHHALACARAAQLAYGDDLPAASAQAVRRGNHHCLLQRLDECLLLAFRGTDEWADWGTNLSLLPRRTALGSVHGGFMTATELFWPELPTLLKAHDSQALPLLVTGHSMGGALALLAATKLHIELGVSIAGLYTFGQPSLAGDDFCERFSELCPFPCFRFVNRTDAVVDAGGMVYQPVGQQLYFNVDGEMIVGEPSFRTGMRDHLLSPHRYGGLEKFQAHQISDYLELLGRLLPSDPT